MYLINEALARAQIREREHRAQQARLCMELAAENRWHYLAERARVARRRRAVAARVRADLASRAVAGR